MGQRTQWLKRLDNVAREVHVAELQCDQAIFRFSEIVKPVKFAEVREIKRLDLGRLLSQ